MKDLPSAVSHPAGLAADGVLDAGLPRPCAPDPGLPAPRICAFDALRAVALLLGIVLHASESFIPGNRAWVIVDRSTSVAAAAMVFVIHVFRLAAFFLMAGYFARMVCERKGPGLFARDRVKRILLPLVGGWVILTPLITWAWIWGMQVTGNSRLPPEARVMPSMLVTAYAIATGEAFRDGLSLGHLWFLYYLLLLYAIQFGVLRLRIGPPVDALFSRLLRSATGAGLLALPAALALGLTSQHFGVPTPDRSLLPDWRPLLAYGSLYLAGWLLHRQAALLESLAARRRTNLGLALLFTGAAILTTNVPASPARIVHWLHASAYALAMWYWVLGLAGWFLVNFARPAPAWRYLSDASYFLYLAHLPLVAFLQVGISFVAWHWSAKLFVVLAATMAVLLPAYRFLIRPTFVGAILNGRRRPRGLE